MLNLKYIPEKCIYGENYLLSMRLKAKQYWQRRRREELTWRDCKARHRMVSLVLSWHHWMADRFTAMCQQLRQKGLLDGTFSLLSKPQLQPTWSKSLGDKGLGEQMNRNTKTWLNVRQLVYCKSSFYLFFVTVVWVICCSSGSVLWPKRKKPKGVTQWRKMRKGRKQGEEDEVSTAGYLPLDGCC